MKHVVLILTLLISAAAAAQSPSAAAPDEIAQNLFPPDLVLKYRDTIGLDEAQSKSLKELVHKAQGRFLDLQWDMQAETGKLTELLHLPRIDEAAALAQVDKVLAMEREVKKAQISLLIEIKNLLTPTQQQKLIELRGKSP